MEILSERREQILLITINRPEAMNAMTPDMFTEMGRLFEEYRDDDALRACVITGAGDRAFCAGADLVRMSRREGDDRAPSQRPARRPSPFDVEGLWKPLVAAINGHCLAGGLALALQCDIRIASRNATFGAMGVRRGILPGAGQTQRLTRMIPLAKAMELLLAVGPLDGRIDAEEAYRVGLVNRLVEREELLDTALAWAGVLCEAAPLAVQATKEAALRGLELPLDAGMRLEQMLGAAVARTEDAREGPRAFAEKRKPEFHGR